MKTIAVYGSLKAGKYNHGILEDSLYLDTTKVSGTLYRVSSYPALVDEGDNLYDAEIYEVSDNVYEWIAGMERGAGYKEVNVDGHIVYYAGDSLKNRCKENYEIISEY